MKIVIKCEGLTVRTKDLGMGLSILNRIANSGIMGHTFIPNTLLTKAIKVIDSATNAGAMAKKLLQKTKENFVMPEFAPAEEVATEEEVKKLPGKKKRKSGIKSMSWTVEEDKLLCDLKDKTPTQIAKRRGLKRHTKHAIKTRLSIYRNEKFDRLNSDRADIMRAYLSGEQVTTPVVDINKNVSTPITDAMEKKVMSKVDKSSKLRRWTAEELQLVKDNLHLQDKELAKLIPSRTKAAIVFKKRTMLGKVRQPGAPKSTRVMNKWTEDELEAIKLNIHMKPKQLAELPWLKDRNIKQIAQKKWELKHKE